MLTSAHGLAVQPVSAGQHLDVLFAAHLNLSGSQIGLAAGVGVKINRFVGGEILAAFLQVLNQIRERQTDRAGN